MSLPVGFFMPLPLPMMIPFMGIQSAVMAQQFGEGFQYGKRRISAMSNEEFNKLTPLSLLQRKTSEIQSMIPEMEKQIKMMSPLVRIIIEEFGRMVQLGLAALPAALQTATSGTSPQDIIINLSHDIESGKIDTSSGGGLKQSELLEWLKNRFPSLPEAGGFDEPIPPPPSPPGDLPVGIPTPTAGSRIHAPSITPAPYLPSLGPSTQLPFRESFTQYGVANMSLEKAKAIAVLELMEENMAIAIEKRDKFQSLMNTRGYEWAQRSFDQYRKIVTDYSTNIVRQKLLISRIS